MVNANRISDIHSPLSCQSEVLYVHQIIHWLDKYIRSVLSRDERHVESIHNKVISQFHLWIFIVNSVKGDALFSLDICHGKC